jgi:hypothetical protein
MRHAKVVSIPSVAMLAIVCACAPSSSVSTTPTQRTETIYTGGSGKLTVNPDNGAATRVIEAPLEKVWQLLPSAYDSVAVPLTLIDPKRHVIGNEGFKLRQTLGKKRLSTFFECGTTQVGPNADSYEVYLTVLTNLEADGPTRTKLTTSITAAAKPMQFAQDYSRCSSKSALETRIADIMAAAATKP